MKTATQLSVLALLSCVLASGLNAEARGYLAYKTTAVRLADQAQVIVSGTLLRVENVQISETGIDAARHRRIGDGAWQDGESGIRREAVLSVNEVLKGTAELGSELRFVSIRQLQFEAYDADLREGDAVYFLHARPEDQRLIVLSEERGTISKPESNGNVAIAADYVRAYLAAGSKGAWLDKLVNAIDLKAGRLSVDGCIELSWNHEDYQTAMTETVRQQIASLARLSKSGTRERNELLTAIGRFKPEGGLDTLLDIMLSDPHWSTTSLASMSLEYIDRGQAIGRLHQAWESAQSDATRMVIVRSLGLIRPKVGHDGPALRDRTLEIVASQLDAHKDKALLRESLIASRDLRSEGAHLKLLKKLIDERHSNGLGSSEIQAAIVALAAARKIEHNATGPDAVTVLEKDYLIALGNSDPVLKQTVVAALKTPYTTLIKGADGKGH